MSSGSMFLRLKNSHLKSDRNRVHRSLRRRSGTTLAEMLVATAFLGICSTAILSSITTATKTGARSQDRLIALTLAEQELDRLRSTAVEVALTPGTTSNVLTNTGIKGKVTVTTTITAADATGKLFNVRVQVSWTTEPSFSLMKTTDVTLETYIRAPED